MFLLDSHCDTPSAMMRGRDIGKDNEKGHVDFPKLRAGKVDASFFALYTSASLSEDEATVRALEMIGRINDALEENSRVAALAVSPEQMIENKANGLISILLGMENGAPIHRSLQLLRTFYRLGVRYVTLTHNADNEIADSAAQGTRWNGLSPFGREVVDEMNRLGMIVDIAHASDKTFFDVLECSRGPIVSTHSCCRALAGHRRNMTDEMLRAMADKGGVMQVNFYPIFLSDEYARLVAESGIEICDENEEQLMKLARPSYKRIADHIDHAVKVAGIDHVGIGSDFDGIEVTPEGLEDISKIGVLFDELTIRGYSDDEIDKIAGEKLPESV
jgi:Zn-dependent dipeptidase, microsomal dipeptidase homolog